MKLYLFISLRALCSCGQSASHSLVEKMGRRDVIEYIECTPIDMNLPAIHAFSNIKIIGDTLIIHDHTSTEHQFLTYDIVQDRYIGSFGKSGNGPGEISNFGSIFIVPHKRTVCGIDGNKWHVSAFRLDSALAAPDYDAETIADLDVSKGRFPLNYANYLNDTTIICSVYMPNKDNTGLATRLGRLNLISGTTEVIDDIEPENKVRSSVAVSQRKNLIVTADLTHDRIRFYSLDGQLIKTVYGPDFTEQPNGRKSYYSSPVIAGDKIYIVYLGKDLMEQRFGNEIVVTDLDGHYLKSLRLNNQIVSIDYHEKSDRLYMSLEGDTQFGYIQL